MKLIHAEIAVLLLGTMGLFGFTTQGASTGEGQITHTQKGSGPVGTPACLAPCSPGTTVNIPFATTYSLSCALSGSDDYWENIMTITPEYCANGTVYVCGEISVGPCTTYDPQPSCPSGTCK